MKKKNPPEGTAMVNEADLKEMQEIAAKLKSLPHDRMMYIAGAIHMAASMPPTNAPEEGQEGQKGA